MLALLLVVATQPPVAPSTQAGDQFAKWEKSIIAVEKRLELKPPKPGGVFYVGSSTIVRWDLKKYFPDNDYVNVGFGGSVIADSTHFAPRIISPYKPSVIVFYSGDNDIGAGRNAKQVVEDFQAFLKTARRDNPSCRVLFLGVKPSIARWNKFEEQKQANTLVRDLCEKGDRLSYVDTMTPMLNLDGKPREELFVKDGLHLSPKGYELFTELVNKTMK